MQNTNKPEVRFGDWISEGWKMFTEQWAAWVINSLIFLGLTVFPMVAIIMGYYIYFFSLMNTSPGSAPPDIQEQTLIGFVVVMLALMAFSLVAQSFLIGGMHISALKQLRGEKVEVRDLLTGGRYFFSILGAMLLIGILAIIGYLFCILPALLVFGAFFFTIPLIIDRGLSAVEAMKTSYALTRQNLFMFALFAFVLYLLASAGSYLCYVGMLATYPLLFTITAVAYRDLFGVEGARYFRPIAPPPDFRQPYPDVYQRPQPMGYALPPPANESQKAADPPVQAYSETSPDHPENPASPAPGQKPTATEQLVPPVNDAVTSATSGLVCSHCQTALPPTAGFCPRCGARVGS